MLRKVWRSINNMHHVLTLSAGALAAQVITLLLMPVLTRIYMPDDFGMLSIFVSVYAFLLVLSCGRYELAIVLPRADRDAGDVLNLSVRILFFFLFLLTA